MARTIEAVVPSEATDGFLDRVGGWPGVLGLSVQRGASVKPAGDVVVILAINDAVGDILRCLDGCGVMRIGSAALSEPTAVIAPRDQDTVDRESNEGAWEEVASLIRRDTNVTLNYLALMTASGGIAAVGLLSDTIHIMVGAMLLAPGFEPLVRIPFGLLARGQRTTAGSGVAAMLWGYLFLAGGAAAVALLLLALGHGNGGTLLGLHWVGYWTNPSLTAPVIAVVAGIAGAIVVSSRRTLFATGVMVALALVPGMAILGIGLVFGEVGIAAKGLMRWAIDAACVLLSTAVVLGLKRRFLHWRRVVD